MVAQVAVVAVVAMQPTTVVAVAVAVTQLPLVKLVQDIQVFVLLDTQLKLNKI
jgi:predicted aconitase with swiveling domain